jgi:hypothetical protein
MFSSGRKELIAPQSVGHTVGVTRIDGIYSPRLTRSRLSGAASTMRNQEMPTSRLNILQFLFGRDGMHKAFKNTVGHGLFGIALGWFLAYVGRSDMVLRSIGVFIGVLWLTIDVGVWLASKNSNWAQRWAPVGFAVICCLFSCMGLQIIKAFLNSDLEDERADVFQKLTANHYNLDSEQDPMKTVFSVVNSGAYTISKKHEITCVTRLAVGNDGLSAAESIESSLHDGMQRFGHGPLPHLISQSVIQSGGDAESDACLSYLEFRSVDCVDMEVKFWFSLEDQPDVEREKRFRFVAFQGSEGNFTWIRETVESPTNYCAPALKFNPHP